MKKKCARGHDWWQPLEATWLVCLRCSRDFSLICYDGVVAIPADADPSQLDLTMFSTPKETPMNSRKFLDTAKPNTVISATMKASARRGVLLVRTGDRWNPSSIEGASYTSDQIYDYELIALPANSQPEITDEEVLKEFGVDGYGYGHPRLPTRVVDERSFLAVARELLELRQQAGTRE